MDRKIEKREGRGHTGSALIKVENISDGGFEETLVVALELTFD
jgi:hypothetical protein